MHNQMDVLMDKTTMPWLDPMQKDVYLNLALDDWPNWLYDGFEKSARRRTELSDLVRHYKAEGKKVIDKREIAKLRYIVGIRGQYWFYEFDENGKAVEVKDIIPIEPMSHDEIGVAYTDPQRRPTDNFPFYSEYKDGEVPTIEIHSDNIPVFVEVSYLEDFGTINGLDDPNEKLTLPDPVCRKIVQLAAVKAQAGTMDPRYEASNAELQRAS